MALWSVSSSNVVTMSLLLSVLGMVMMSLEAADIPRVPNVRPVRRHNIRDRRDISRLEDIPPEIRALMASPMPANSEPPVGNPDCFVEIDVPKRVGGRCRRMPGNLPVCSVNDNLYVNHPDCS